MLQAEQIIIGDSREDHLPVPAVISGFAKGELTNAVSFQNMFTAG